MRRVWCMRKKWSAIIKGEPSAERFGQSAGMGLTLGIFPIMGCSTALCGVLGIMFRLNQGIVHLVTQLTFGLKLILIIPFIRLGEWLFSAPPFTLSIAEFSALFESEGFVVVRQFAATFMHAIAGWMITAPILYLLTGFAATMAAKRWQTSSPLTSQ